ncbi:STAS domain-containing protein [Streptomyces sp.]|uniref:STAS domain-containing protein n=1 Tax=Streptomyces sp. TaxID=1931 RepID=UPI002F943065
MEAAGRTGARAAARVGDTDARFAVEIETREGPHDVVLTLHGELDQDTVDALRDALSARPDARRIVVDCSGLRFCDSSGLNVLLRTRMRMRERGGRLDLAGLRPPVDRMFEITGARSVFRVYEDVAAALSPEPDDERAGGPAPASRARSPRRS